MSKWMSKICSDFGIIAEELNTSLLPVIPSRSPSLNWATGVGGFQPGKISILYGPESSGKSLLAMMAVADYQKRDSEAIFIWFDAEFSFNLPLFIKIGGDPKRLVIRKSNDPFKIFDYIGTTLLELLQDGAPIRGLIIDSIKSIRYPKESNMKKTTDQKMGGTGAAYLPTALKLIIPVIAEHNLLAFCIQQVTKELDPMKALRNPFVITEGQALKHAADIMLEITKVENKKSVLEGGDTISGSTAQVGHQIRVKVKKNRLGVPARQAQFTYHYTHGIINTDQEIYELAKSLGIIYHPISSTTNKPSLVLWQFANYPAIKGEANMIAWLKESTKIQEEVLQACNNYKDSPITIDSDGCVVEEIDADVSINLEEV